MVWGTSYLHYQPWIMRIHLTRSSQRSLKSLSSEPRGYVAEPLQQRMLTKLRKLTNHHFRIIILAPVFLDLWTVLANSAIFQKKSPEKHSETFGGLVHTADFSESSVTRLPIFYKFETLKAIIKSVSRY